MDFLNKTFSQIADLYRSMTPGARITSALLMAAIVVSLGYLFRTQGAGANVELLNGQAFTPAQQQVMLAAFGEAGLTGWEFDGPRILVPRAKQDAFLAALAKSDALPELPDDAMTKALDTTSSIWVDSKHREELIKQAKQRKLSLIIREMPGIENAWVMYDTEKRYGLNQRNESTAQVSVTPSGSEPLSGETVAAIRKMVAFGIAGLTPEKVVVIDVKRKISYTGDGENTSDTGDPIHLVHQKEHQDHWLRTIKSALPPIEGMLVSVSVELNDERLHREQQIKHDPKTVPIRRDEKVRSKLLESAAPAGRPGFEAQQPNTKMVLASAKGTRQEEEESDTNEVNLAGSTQTVTEKVPMGLNWVKAVVNVPTSYFVKIWQQRNPGAPGEQKTPTQAELDAVKLQELAKIENTVASLLPPPQGLPADAKLVSVTEFEAFPPEEIPAPSVQERALSWLADNWSTLGLILLALVSLVVLRSMARATPAAMRSSERPALDAALASSEPATEEAAEEHVNAAERRLKRLTGSGTSLRDELTELVAEDPDAAANILRTWIGHVSP